MKQKTLKLVICITLALVGLTFLVLSMFQDENNQLFLSLGLLCTTVGLFITCITNKKEK